MRQELNPEPEHEERVLPLLIPTRIHGDTYTRMYRPSHIIIRFRVLQPRIASENLWWI